MTGVAFDVTRAGLIKAIVCERGVIEPVSRDSIAAMLGPQRSPAAQRR